MVGIKAWKKPNQRPQIKAMCQENFLVVKPLQMETEKASMERPMAINSSSTKFISKDLSDKNKTFLLAPDGKTLFLQSTKPIRQ